MKAFAISSVIALALLFGCSGKQQAPTINHSATLIGTLPYNPLGWKVVTSSLNQRSGTMSTLYGNDIAVKYARSHADSTYPSGAVLALVTWTEQDDPHWFGGRIPSAPQSVEFVIVPQGGGPDYQRYEGSPLALVDAPNAVERVGYLTSQRAAVMP